MNAIRTQYRNWQKDISTLLSIAARALQIVAGLGTVLVVAVCFSPAQQGYFFTFQSLIAAQSLIDLGLSLAIVQFCAHERAGLRLAKGGLIIGPSLNRRRVLDIAVVGQTWFAVGSIAFMVIMMPLGVWLFSSTAYVDSAEWLWPWVTYVCVASLNIWLIPVMAVAEGLGQIGETAVVRMTQYFLGSLLLWSMAWMGLGLWSATGFQMGLLATALFWIGLKRRKALVQVFRHLSRHRAFEWREEVGQFQMKLAASWACGYFMYHSISPIVFHTLGPIEAGKFGMSQSMSVSIGILGLAWVYAKAPLFGHLVALGDGQRLRAAFKETLVGSSSLVALLSIALLLGVAIIGYTHSSFAARILHPLEFALLLGAALANHMLATFAMYIRAHKCELFTSLSAAGVVLIVTTTWLSGTMYQSLTCVTLGFLLVNAAILLPWGYLLYRQFRQAK